MRVLKVQGKGRVSAEPDLVTISFKVEVNAKEYDKCLLILNSKTDALRHDLFLSGLDKTQLKTSDFSVDINKRYRNNRYVTEGYIASHCLQIELPMDTKMLNRVLAQVAKGNSGAEINLEFSVEDKKALHQQVLADAVQKAKANAKILADAADVKLGNIVQMDYGWSEIRISECSSGMVCESSCDTLFDADITPTDVTADDNVTMVYEIVD